ncbi:MAG: hypothetical protein LBT03_00340 [Holosporales bacterium]|jgi:hypothetical protein|nr:hypothetical protein [Holosporales bacterium]
MRRYDRAEAYITKGGVPDWAYLAMDHEVNKASCSPVIISLGDKHATNSNAEVEQFGNFDGQNILEVIAHGQAVDSMTGNNRLSNVNRQFNVKATPGWVIIPYNPVVASIMASVISGAIDVIMMATLIASQSGQKTKAEVETLYEYINAIIIAQEIFNRWVMIQFTYVVLKITTRYFTQEATGNKLTPSGQRVIEVNFGAGTTELS